MDWSGGSDFKRFFRLARRYLELEMKTDAGRVNMAGLALLLVISAGLFALGVINQIAGWVTGTNANQSLYLVGALIITAIYGVTCVSFLARDDKAGHG